MFVRQHERGGGGGPTQHWPSPQPTAPCQLIESQTKIYPITLHAPNFVVHLAKYTRGTAPAGAKHRGSTCKPNPTPRSPFRPPSPREGQGVGSLVTMRTKIVTPPHQHSSSTSTPPRKPPPTSSSPSPIPTKPSPRSRGGSEPPSTLSPSGSTVQRFSSASKP